MTSTTPDHPMLIAETLAHRVLAALYAHRMATTDHLHRLLAPASARKVFQNRLRALRDRGLVDHITAPRPGQMRIWFLTSRGQTLAATWPEVRGMNQPSLATDPEAVSLSSAHTLAVVRTHLSFVEDARRRGDEHGPLDYLHEVLHKVAEGSEALKADALLRYTAVSKRGRNMLRAFVEVDRATMSSERLAAKLIAYARFYDHTPAVTSRRAADQGQGVLPLWQRHYPRYPRVLFVLTGAGQDALRNRIEDLKAQVASHPLVADFAQQVPLGAAVLEEIEQHGPSATVWTPLDGRDARCGWIEL